MGAMRVNSASTYYVYEPISGGNLRNNTVSSAEETWNKTYQNSHSTMAGSTLSAELNSKIQASIGNEHVGSVTTEASSKVVHQ